MHRTIKLPYIASDTRFTGILADLRRRQSRATRTAYCRLAEGLAPKQLYPALRSHSVGQGMHSWLISSAISKATALCKRRPEGKVGRCTHYPDPRKETVVRCTVRSQRQPK